MGMYSCCSRAYKQDFRDFYQKNGVVHALYMRSEKGEIQAGNLPAETQASSYPEKVIYGKWHVKCMHKVDFGLIFG